MKEYTVEDLRSVAIWYRDDRLNELGREGWRLISVDDHIVYLERDVPKTAEERHD
jgi:hypothetical protein